MIMMHDPTCDVCVFTEGLLVLTFDGFKISLNDLPDIISLQNVICLCDLRRDCQAPVVPRLAVRKESAIFPLKGVFKIQVIQGIFKRLLLRTFSACVRGVW